MRKSTNPFHEYLYPETNYNNEGTETKSVSQKWAEATNGILSGDIFADYADTNSTTNAIKAVLGYDPKDDKRLCKFSVFGKDSCFKGANCRLEHYTNLPNGWTRDDAPTHVDIRNEIVYPTTGSKITIIPTHIVNVEVFYCHIFSEKFRYQSTLRQLIWKMNSPEAVISYKPVSLPIKLELVLALYNDGIWYRAKVLDIINNTTIKVFYVDYGTASIVPLEKVRRWEPSFDYLPFQAVACKLIGVAEKSHCRIEATVYLRKMILNKFINATVIHNIDRLFLQLIDNDDELVSDKLINMGLADKRETFLPSKSQQFIPV